MYFFVLSMCIAMILRLVFVLGEEIDYGEEQHVFEWQIVKVRGIDKMNLLVSHFMKEYKLSREQAEALLNESLTDFDVMRTILKAADRRVIMQ